MKLNGLIKPIFTVSYSRDFKSGLYIAKATYFDKCAFASGKTMNLLRHNIDQNIRKRGWNPDVFVWDEKISDKIDLTGATDMFLRKFNCQAREIARKETAPRVKIVNKRVAVPVEDNPAKDTFGPTVSPNHFAKDEGDYMVVYEMREVARYKKYNG